MLHACSGSTWPSAAGTQLRRKPLLPLTPALGAQAKRGDTDVLICDTSGRLHTNYELMEELGSCKDALSKRMKDAPHEVLLVLDGTTGDRSSPAKGSASVKHAGLMLCGAHCLIDLATCHAKAPRKYGTISSPGLSPCGDIL